jgi:CheY-like chemotaxis protein
MQISVMKKIRNVLLIDDDNINNFITYKLLAKLKLAKRVRIAQNGYEALNDILKRSSSTYLICPDLIILDYMMPVMDGLEFMRSFNRLNFVNRQQAIILLLSTAGDSEQEEFKKLGVDYFASKPLTKQTILSIHHQFFQADKTIRKLS